MAHDGEDPRLRAKRGEMVLDQIVRRGVKDPRVVAAMASVPRDRFVSPSLVERAYDDTPLAIGFGQTISQPYMVARVTELVEPQPGDRGLEIGAGCGYQTAILARLCREVYGLEIIPELAATAARTLAALGVTNAAIEAGDGSGGWSEHAPYDVIVVAAGAPRVPLLLVDELARGGRLVVPIGDADEQVLAVVRHTPSGYETSYDTRCRYVPLRGRYGIGSTPVLA